MGFPQQRGLILVQHSCLLHFLTALRNWASYGSAYLAWWRQAALFKAHLNEVPLAMRLTASTRPKKARAA